MPVFDDINSSSMPVPGQHCLFGRRGVSLGKLIREFRTCLRYLCALMAAGGRSFFDDVKRELECCICQEQFNATKEPKILKCLHTFCKSCLEDWLHQRAREKLSCPTCRQITECPDKNINSLPSNLFYKQMVEIVEAYSGNGQGDPPHCGSCDERKSVDLYCSHCNCFLCEDCSMAHKKLKALSSHHVKEIRNFKSSNVQEYARKLNFCNEHGDEVRFYCEQCVTCICRDCAILEHRDHKFVSIDKGLERNISQLGVTVIEVKANKSEIERKKEFLEKRRITMNQSIEQATEEVQRTANRNISLIRQHEACMIEQLLKRKETYEAAFTKTVTDLDEHLKVIESSLKFANNIVERSNLTEILNVKEVLQQRFQELSKQPKSVDVELNYSRVKYVPNDLSSLIDTPGELFMTKTEPSLSLAQGELTEGTLHKECVFKVVTKDLLGNTTYSEIDDVFVDIKSLKKETGLTVNITDLHDGSYNVSYKPETAEEFIVSIIAKESIKSSPFQLKVEERKPKKRGRKQRKEGIFYFPPFH